MPKSDYDVRVTPSVLDRLLDSDHKSLRDPVVSRAESVRELRLAVQRDLESLLNSRNPYSDLPAAFAEAGQSVITYGLPDFSALNVANTNDQHRLRQLIERTIRTFEPRLIGVNTTLMPASPTDRSMRLRIDARLVMDPSPEAGQLRRHHAPADAQVRGEGRLLMRDELLTYYERELTFIRRMATEFADKYPKIAGRLLLERGKCEDPHVERLIESFALLAARIHLKIDDEFPEITESLLQVLYPHYSVPDPLDVDRAVRARSRAGEAVDRLHHRAASDALLEARARTPSAGSGPAIPVTLWPIEVQAARIDTPGVVGVGRARRRRPCSRCACAPRATRCSPSWRSTASASS